MGCQRTFFLGGAGGRRTHGVPPQRRFGALVHRAPDPREASLLLLHSFEWCQAMPNIGALLNVEVVLALVGDLSVASGTQPTTLQ